MAQDAKIGKALANSYLQASRDPKYLFLLRSSYTTFTFPFLVSEAKPILRDIFGGEVQDEYLPVLCYLVMQPEVPVVFEEIVTLIYNGDTKKTRALLDEMVQQDILKSEKVGKKRAKQIDRTGKKAREQLRVKVHSEEMLPLINTTPESNLYQLTHPLFAYFFVLFAIKHGFGRKEELRNPDAIPVIITRVDLVPSGVVLPWSKGGSKNVKVKPGVKLDDVLKHLLKHKWIKRVDDRYVLDLGNCPFQVGDRVRFVPDKATETWFAGVWGEYKWYKRYPDSTKRFYKIHPGYVGKVTKVEYDTYVYLDKGAGGFPWNLYELVKKK